MPPTLAVVRIPATATRIEWELIKGSSTDLVVPVLDSLDQLVDVTGWSALAQAWRSPDDPVRYEWSAGAGNIATGPAGVTLSVDGAVSRLWTWSDAHISVATTGPGGKPHVIAYGTVHALPIPPA